jgi:hypothetical protein
MRSIQEPLKCRGNEDYSCKRHGSSLSAKYLNGLRLFGLSMPEFGSQKVMVSTNHGEKPNGHRQ